MSTDRDVTRIVRSWLEEGPTALPDWILDAVLDQVPATPQRRATWPAWRFKGMNTSLRIAIAAAAILVVAVVGVNLLPQQGAISEPSPTAGATLTPSPSPLPSSPSAASPQWPFWPGGRENPPGRYSWTSNADRWMHKPGAGELGVEIRFAVSANAYRVGPTALTIAGYRGTYQELPAGANGARRQVWIVDIDGTRVTITVDAPAGTPAADLAEARAIIDSIRREPWGMPPNFMLTFALPAGWDSG